MQTQTATASAAPFNPAMRPAYSTKSNCKRAALKAGIPEHLIAVEPVGANWQYFQKDEPVSALDEAVAAADAAGATPGQIGCIAGAFEGQTEQTTEIEAAKKKPVKKAPKAKPTRAPKAAKEAKPKKEGGSLKDKTLAMLKRASGATAAEIGEETGWQAHTIRAFISTVPRKVGLLVKTEKHPTRGRVYRTEAGE